MGPVAEAPRGSESRRLTEEELLSALPARSANREVRVGLFVLLGVIAFLTILFTMTDVGTFRGRYYANTVVPSAGGMRRGDAVQMRGVNIGRVIGFEMVPGGVSVRMEVYDEYPIPADSYAEVESNGLLGSMVVDIVPGVSEKELEDGASIPGRTPSGVFEQASGIGVRADTALMRVNQILSPQTVGALNTSAVETRALIAELNALAAQQRAELAALSASLRRSASGVERATAGPELERSVQRIDALTARMDEATQRLSQTSGSLQAVTGRLERGEGTLGKLTTDDRLYDNMSTTVANMNTTVNNLNSLIDDIKANPKKYINLQVF